MLNDVSTVLIPHVIAVAVAVAVAVAHCRCCGGLMLTWRCSIPDSLISLVVLLVRDIYYFTYSYYKSLKVYDFVIIIG